MRFPAKEPMASSTVKRSVSTWTGWPPSVRPLMTGIELQRTNSSSRASAVVRITTASAYPETTREVSESGSPRASWLVLALSSMA